MNNLSSYCGLTDSRMRASDTDLPVPTTLHHISLYQMGGVYWSQEIVNCTLFCLRYMEKESFFIILLAENTITY